MSLDSEKGQDFVDNPRPAPMRAFRRCQTPWRGALGIAGGPAQKSTDISYQGQLLKAAMSRQLRRATSPVGARNASQIEAYFRDRAKVRLHVKCPYLCVFESQFSQIEQVSSRQIWRRLRVFFCVLPGQDNSSTLKLIHSFQHGSDRGKKKCLAKEPCKARHRLPPDSYRILRILKTSSTRSIWSLRYWPLPLPLLSFC